MINSQKTPAMIKAVLPNQQVRRDSSQHDNDSVSRATSRIDTSFDSSQPGMIKTSKRSTRQSVQDSESQQHSRRAVSKRTLAAIVTSVALITLITLLVYYLFRFRSLIPHNDIEQIIASWNKAGSTNSNLGYYPTDFSRDIEPIPCHSHNDYWRRIPLYDALAAGCSSVEADIWLAKDDELHVGHSENSLTATRTLRSLYINPLVQILEHQNQAPQTSNVISMPLKERGVFDTDPSTSLILLVDIKSSGSQTFPVLQTHLEPLRLRGFLTHFDGTTLIPGPITVVATGNTPFTLLTANSTYRDIFYDAPLDALWGENAPSNSTLYNPFNSYYASVSFEKAIGRPWMGMLTPEQTMMIRGQIKGARERGLSSRYWDTPAWPIRTREHVWDVLEREGVGMLNVDDLEAASKRKW